ncbi:MAG TPA: hypothetical protein VK434_13805 [Microvirga sp.]|jgi:hypothetical protein|nr:hypothetical protein [Microvirga sp.]
MLVAIIGFFKPGADLASPSLQRELNEHFGPTPLNLRAAGYLHDPKGRKVGVMALAEAEDFTLAEAYLQASPFVRGDLLEWTEIVEYVIEVGRFE